MPQLLGKGGIPLLPCCFLLICTRSGGYFSQLPWELWLCLIKGCAQLPKSTSIQQSLCAVPPPLLTVQGLLLLPADLCVFLETSSARHVSAEVQLSVGDSRR